ncbi:MAG TPA: hypothetical protein VF808_05235 [Ktedonobacterales bacterium]
MFSRFKASTWRAVASGALVAVVVLSGVAGILSQHRAQASSVTGKHVWAVSARARAGATRSGAVNLATLPSASATQLQAARALVLPELSNRTPAQLAAYRQYLETHPSVVPHAPGVKGGPSASTPRPNIYGNGIVPVITSTHAGLSSTSSGGASRPDQAIAAAPGYVFEGVNNTLEVFTTSYGQKYGPWTADQFFASVKHTGDVFSSPQITFDAERAIYVISWLELTSDLQNDYIDIAVSKSSTPSPLTNFLVYQINAQVAGANNFCDYDTLGYDYWGAYITCTTYNRVAGTWLGNETFAIGLNGMLQGTFAAVLYGAVMTVASGVTGQQAAYRVSPTMEDGVPQAEWLTATYAGLFGVSPSNGFVVCAITNTHALGTTTDPTYTCVLSFLPYYDDPVAADQPGLPASITPSVGYKQVAYRNGQLYFAMSEALTCGSDTVVTDGIYWAAVTPQLTTVATANPQQVTGISQSYFQWGAFCFANNSDFLYLPTMMADTEGDMILVFNDSSASRAPSILETGRAADDVEGTMGQGPSGGSGAWTEVVAGANASGSKQFCAYSACAVTTNLVTRGTVYCGGQFGGPNTSTSTSGWDTELYSLRMQ